MARREELLTQLWDAQDLAYDLMLEYDAMPRHYGHHVLYQAEGYIVDLIARHPGITITDLANILKKTPSACSQIVRRLKAKGFVEQIRNHKNNRQFNLQLAEDGQRVYSDHVAFNKDCQERAFRLLESFTEEELEHHVKVQQRINEAYRGDIRRSRERFARAQTKK